jgi:hypothetical protein
MRFRAYSPSSLHSARSNSTPENSIIWTSEDISRSAYLHRAYDTVLRTPRAVSGTPPALKRRLVGACASFVWMLSLCQEMESIRSMTTPRLHDEKFCTCPRRDQISSLGICPWQAPIFGKRRGYPVDESKHAIFSQDHPKFGIKSPG